MQALGLAQLNDNDLTAAERSLSQAVEVDSRLTAAWFARSRIRLQSLQEVAALHDLDTVIQKSPEHTAARLQRARLLVDSHPEQAIEDLTVLLHKDRLNTEAAAAARAGMGKCRKPAASVGRSGCRLPVAA